MNGVLLTSLLINKRGRRREAECLSLLPFIGGGRVLDGGGDSVIVVLHIDEGFGMARGCALVEDLDKGMRVVK
jgi:hypothetical protein